MTVRLDLRGSYEILSGYGIAHTSEIYEGDHVNRVEERLEKNVLPFFSKQLKN